MGTQSFTLVDGSVATIPPTELNPITAQDLIDHALMEINATAAGEVTQIEDASLGLRWLNRMLDSWNARKVFCYRYYHNSWAWATSKQSYTIGQQAGADFDVDRPVRIYKANLVVPTFTPALHQPLNVIMVEKYSDITFPAQSGNEPTHLYYQPTWPNGTLWPWPYPTVTANLLELFYLAQFSAFTNLYDTVQLPPGYEEAVVLTLAERLSIPLTRALPPELKDQARRARAVIAGLNSVPPALKGDTGVPKAEAWS